MFSGAIFHAGDEEHKAAFLKAVYEARFEHVAPAFEFQPIIKQVEVNIDSFKTAIAGLYEFSIQLISSLARADERREISHASGLKQLMNQLKS